MPMFCELQPISVLVVAAHKNYMFALQGTERRRTFFNIEAVVHVLAQVEAIPNHRDQVGPVFIHRFREGRIQLSALMHICDRQDRDLSYFDFLTAHTVTSMRLASDSSFDFR